MSMEEPQDATIWKTVLPTRRPLAGEVHLWLDDSSHPTDADLASLADCLSDEERVRQQRFVNDELRRRFARRRIMLRHVLSFYRPNISPAEWQYVHNAFGRPAIAPDPLLDELHFNLSHSQDRTLIAISAHESIGVDIEQTIVNGDTDHLSVASNYFTTSECQWINAVHESQRIDRFFDLWTLKEAYIKALGVGLSRPLDQFQFHIDDDAGAIRVQDNEPAEGWAFALDSLSPGYRYAVARRLDTSETLTLRRVRFSACPLVRQVKQN